MNLYMPKKRYANRPIFGASFSYCKSGFRFRIFSIVRRRLQRHRRNFVQLTMTSHQQGKIKTKMACADVREDSDVPTSESSSENSDSEPEFSPIYGLDIEGCVLPYQFEPEYSDDELEEHIEEEGTQLEGDRLTSLSWCTCGECAIMPTLEECVCCNEYEKITQKMLEAEHEGCITGHPGFSAVCLNVWALQTAYLQYRTKYGNYPGPVHERYRYTAYRQFVRFCWGYVGKDIRKILPSCVVTRIRKEFPSPEYTGFKYPDLA